MANLSSSFLYSAFIIYLIAIVFFAASIKKQHNLHAVNRPAKIAVILTVIGFLLQVSYFITRWIASSHAPVSNMFEFTTFFGMMIVAAFLLFYMIYRTPIIGLFALLVAVLTIAYASMFPRDITPLIPALKSHWLYIHVTTAATAEAILSISFVAGLIYLIKVVDQSRRSKKTFWLEFILYFIVVIIGFVAAATVFSVTDYHEHFQYTNKEQVQVEAEYRMPAIVGAPDAITASGKEPLLHVPTTINAKKLNTVIWSLLVGSVIYMGIRLLLQKRIGAFLQRFVSSTSETLLDEIGYRSVLIGFPVFTLGALIFAMIWAQVAWNRFWGWDPKEIWAAITFLFYAAFLHLRFAKDWQGEKSAWLAVIGFAIIMFNLVAVNLIIAGLHSYA